MEIQHNVTKPLDMQLTSCSNDLSDLHLLKPQMFTHIAVTYFSQWM